MKVVVFNLMIPIAIDELNKEMGSILLCRVLVRLIIYRLEVASRLVELLVVLRMCDWFNGVAAPTAPLAAFRLD